MVGSSLSSHDMQYFRSLVRVGFVALVGLSAALTAFQGGASLVEVTVIALLGACAGVGLLRYLLWMDVAWNESRRRQRRR
jgi:hypothetical protein